MSEKLLFKSEFVWEGHLGTIQENMSDIVLSQDRRKPPFHQLFIEAKVQ